MTTDTVVKEAVSCRVGRLDASAAWRRAPACSRPALATMLVRPHHRRDRRLRHPRRGAAAGHRRNLRSHRLRRLHVDQRHGAAAGLRRLRARSRPRRVGSCRDSRLPVAGRAADRRLRRGQQGHRDHRGGCGVRRPTASRWPGPSRGATCSSARSTARIPTGAGFSPRWAPAGPPSRPTPSTSRSTASGSAGARAAGVDRSEVDMSARRVSITIDLQAGDAEVTLLDHRPDG